MSKTVPRPTSADSNLSEVRSAAKSAKFEVASLVEELKLSITNRGLWLFEVVIMADSDNDSLIQRHELGHLLDTLRVAHTADQLEALFSLLDVDSNGAISLQELKDSLSLPETGMNKQDDNTCTFPLPPGSACLEVRGKKAKSITEAEIIDTLKNSQGKLEHVNLSRTCITDETLKRISQHCPKLKVLVLVRCPNITNEGITSISEGCQGLQCINLAGSPVTAQAVNALIRRNNCLRAIAIDTTKQCNEGTILALAHSCPLLEAIDIACSAKVEPEYLGRFISQCPSLAKLRVHGDCSRDFHRDVATFAKANQPLYPQCRIMNHMKVVQSQLITS